MNELTDCQMNYLSMIQGVINRMAASSVTVKGFAATIFAGVLAIVISSGVNHKILALSIAMAVILISAIFDCYYFKLEKEYRQMFEDVRSGNRECDFDLTPQKNDGITIVSVIKSWALWGYYGLLEALMIASIICIAIGLV